MKEHIKLQLFFCLYCYFFCLLRSGARQPWHFFVCIKIAFDHIEFFISVRVSVHMRAAKRLNV